jgi:alkylation response protein AidB-like acyl-CoA dehydrogenase
LLEEAPVDFSLGETQQAAAALARETLARESAETAWKALAQAGLLSMALPTSLGGDGLGVLETVAVLTEVGRAAAPLPALPTLALGVLPIARFGTPAQQEELLPEIGSGDRLLTAALRGRSTTVDGRSLSGTWVGVAYAAAAYRVLVVAGAEVYLVDPRSAGVALVRTPTSSGGPEFSMRLDRVRAEPLGCDAATLSRLAVAAGCAVGDGLLAGALELTSAHLRSREQFGKPLATFQAVAQQIADVYIAARTLHLVTVSACWRLGTGRDADEDLGVAGYWLAEELLPALHTCHHLHGGLGVDVSYPLHRYYALAKDLVRGRVDGP